MARRTNKNGAPKIESVRHKDKRRNIPTEELRGFVREDETRPKQVTYPGLLYARDASLDPQLVWKGKDEQDREPLTVPAVPIYIQEKIHPQALIEDIRRNPPSPGPSPRAGRGAGVGSQAAALGTPPPGPSPSDGEGSGVGLNGEQMSLFADFNGIAFEEMIEFYRHEANWSNRMIVGDSLLVMTSLAEKEGLKGKVQTIYIDPPYGIKFGSNWQVSTRKRDVKDGKVEDATRQPEQVKAFRDTWELGIHSYLAYWRDRLIVARELLTESGSVFVQIGDENVHLVRCVLDEVFGSENFISEISFEKRGAQPDKLLSTVNDVLLWYGKNKEHTKYKQLFLQKGKDVEMTYPWVELPTGERRPLTDAERNFPESLPQGSRPFTTDNLTSSHYYESPPFVWNGKTYTPGNRYWSTSIAGLTKLALAGRLVDAGKTVRMLRYLDDFRVVHLGNVWTDTRPSSFAEEKFYVVQTAQKVLQRCILMTTDPGDLVLDPTCGSGTTAFVAEQWGRRWVTIDTSRVAIALARTRLMAAKFPYYLLADSPEGVRKEAELTGRMPPEALTPTLSQRERENGGDIRKGFVYRRVPHVTLKSIANNPDIKEGMGREEIDRAIARHADTELLYDQPFEDNKRIRVTGPFTVESLSPHRTISVEEKKSREEVGFEDWKIKEIGPNQFGHIVIDNLKKAGVQNTIKQERLRFDRLEPFAGTWIHAAGEYTEKDGNTRRAAVCIGPEHGTVGPELVREAAKEAVKGVGFDLLLVCGFAFDPHVNEEAKQYGKLVVLPTRINADLQMGDEFLKKTGAGNLFTVFGEPDISVSRDKDGRVVVEIRGLDVYDPTTGQIRNHTTDEIACWFIDTNYNGESFFVRHAYFTGADQPYEKLKRALRAEINEQAWSALYATRSRPFDPPATGKIAIKVINHYGDEVLKVYDCKSDKP